MTLLVYGAYGYTGDVVAREATDRGLPVVLAGRDGDSPPRRHRRVVGPRSLRGARRAGGRRRGRAPVRRGFYVVSTDCLAAHLASRLPDATALSPAFEALGSPSPGTAKTTVRGFGEGGAVRRDGEMERVPAAWRTRSAAALAERVLDGDAPAGFRTPSTAYGADFVIDFDGVEREDGPMDEGSTGGR